MEKLSHWSAGLILGGMFLMASLVLFIARPERPIIVEEKTIERVEVTEMMPISFEDFLDSVDETARTCTRIPMMSVRTSWCTNAFGSAERQGYSTCRPCFEDFKRACAPDERTIRASSGETQSECVVRLISEKNVCERIYRIDPESDEYVPAAYISKNDGFTYVKRSCALGRPKNAIPTTDYYRSHCVDNLGPGATSERRQECVDGMIAQWDSGNDNPHPNT